MAAKLYDAYGRRIGRTTGFSVTCQYEVLPDINKNDDISTECVGFICESIESTEPEDYCKDKENVNK